MDIYDEEWFGFRAIKEVLGSKVEFMKASVYDLPTLFPMQFDLVFFLGVLYHLRHPLLALDNIRALTRETAWIESAVADAEMGNRSEEPLTYFFRLDEYKSDSSNWFVPSTKCLADWCQSSGLKPTRVTSWPDSAPIRAVIQAHPTEPEYRKYSYELPLAVVVNSQN